MLTSCQAYYVENYDAASGTFRIVEADPVVKWECLTLDRNSFGCRRQKYEDPARPTSLASTVAPPKARQLYKDKAGVVYFDNTEIPVPASTVPPIVQTKTVYKPVAQRSTPKLSEMVVNVSGPITVKIPEKNKTNSVSDDDKVIREKKVN